jgi:outer membrane protein assembly factor BamB/ferric-dicitrate binding protein FerR (iron transport regulator)
MPLRLVPFVLFALLVGLLSSCAPTAPASAPAKLPVAPAAPAAPPLAQAVVDFVAGQAQANSGQGWVDLEIGDKVGAGATVRTGKDSALELKAGALATLRLSSDTVVKWEALVLDADRRRSQVQVVAGQVLNKVSKLVGGDSYVVRTKTVAMGVRGTQFLVRVSEASSVLAVKEGAVALLPPAFDPSVWQAAGADASAAVEKSLMAASELVSADQRTEIKAGAMTARDQVLAQLGQTLPSDPETLLKSFRDAAAEKAVIQGLKSADKKDLQPLDAMPLGDVVAVAAPAAPPPPPAPVSPTRVLSLIPGHSLASGASWAGGFAVSDGQGQLKAFSPAGKPLWSAAVPAVSNPAVAPVVDASDLVWTGDSALVVLDTKTGTVKRTVTLDATTSGVFGKRAALTPTQLFLGASNGVAVFDRASGARTGTLAFTEGTDMTPALVDGQLFVVGRAGTLYGFDLKSGSPTVTAATAATQPVATAVVAGDKRVWFADRKGQVFAVERTGGPAAWSVNVGSGVFEQPVSDGRSLFVVAKGQLHALALDTGAERFAPQPATSGAFAAAGRVWVADGTTLKALDPTSGRPVWSAQAEVAVSGAAFALGVEVAFPLENGTLFVVDPARLK